MTPEELQSTSTPLLVSRVPLRTLQMCLGELGDYLEFGRLFVEEQHGAQLTAEMALARSHPGTRARLSIAKMTKPFMTLAGRPFTLLCALQNSFASASAGHRSRLMRLCLNKTEQADSGSLGLGNLGAWRPGSGDAKPNRKTSIKGVTGCHKQPKPKQARRVAGHSN